MKLLSSFSLSLGLVMIVLGGCATATQVGNPGLPAIPGVKDITLEVAPETNLDQSVLQSGRERAMSNIEFDATVVSSKQEPGGTTAVTFSLKPALDGDKFNPEQLPTKHRVIPSPATVIIRSSKLAGIPLADLAVSLEVAGQGAHRGKVTALNLFGPRVTDLDMGSAQRRLLDGRWQYVGQGLASCRNPKTGVPYSVKLSGFDGPVFDSYSSGEPPERIDGGYVYLGEDRGQFRLTAKGWTAIQNEAGDGSADYSFLETKAKRGSFD
jgi:hypothetical protein